MKILLYFQRFAALTMSSDSAQKEALAIFESKCKMIYQQIEDFSYFVHTFGRSQDIWGLKVRMTTVEKLWDVYLNPTVNVKHCYWYLPSQTGLTYHDALAKAKRILEDRTLVKAEHEAKLI